MEPTRLKAYLTWGPIMLKTQPGLIYGSPSYEGGINQEISTS